MTSIDSSIADIKDKKVYNVYECEPDFRILNLLNDFRDPKNCKFDITKFRRMIKIYIEMIDNSEPDATILLLTSHTFKYYDLGETLTRDCKTIDHLLRRAEHYFINFRTNVDIQGILNVFTLYTSILLVLNANNKELNSKLERFRLDKCKKEDDKVLYLMGKVSGLRRIRNSKVVVKRAMKTGKFKRFICVSEHFWNDVGRVPIVSPSF